MRYINFPEECNATQPQPQPYTVYKLNQVTQTLLYHINPDTFDVHEEYAPSSTQTDASSILELSQMSFNISSIATTLHQKLHTDYHTVLLKFNFNKTNSLHKKYSTLCNFCDNFNMCAYNKKKTLV